MSGPTEDFDEYKSGFEVTEVESLIRECAVIDNLVYHRREKVLSVLHTAFEDQNDKAYCMEVMGRYSCAAAIHGDEIDILLVVKEGNVGYVGENEVMEQISGLDACRYIDSKQDGHRLLVTTSHDEGFETLQVRPRVMHLPTLAFDH
jgi:hypothetical protein